MTLTDQFTSIDLVQDYFSSRENEKFFAMRGLEFKTLQMPHYDIILCYFFQKWMLYDCSSRTWLFPTFTNNHETWTYLEFSAGLYWLLFNFSDASIPWKLKKKWKIVKHLYVQHELPVTGAFTLIYSIKLEQ